MEELKRRSHPALVHFPITLFPISLVFLLLFYGTGNPFFFMASYWCFMFGVISVIPVALTGLHDMKRLKHVSEQGHRLMNLHLKNGVFITVLSLLLGFFFLWQPPYHREGLFFFYTASLVLLSILVMVQGYVAARMIYGFHLGVEGDTR